ncbi:MAG: hypothetical protein ABIJ56_06310, partial [Pseudomonadota bacterium]
MEKIVSITFALFIAMALASPAGPAGCFSNAKGVEPSREEFHFPTAAIITPQDRYLLVANSNFNLAWELGTLVVVDLDAVDAMIRTECPDSVCEPFTVQEDFVPEEETVLIGSYASFMALSPEGRRIYMTVRGNNSLTVLNLDEEAAPGERITCFDPGDSSRECDANHVVSRSEDISLPSDPYAISVEREGWVFVSHLTSNEVSVFMVDPGSDIGRDIPPALLYVDTSFADSISSIVKHPARDIFLATSRSSSSVAAFRFVWDSMDYDNEPRFYFGSSIRMSGLLSGNDARAIDFSPDGTRAFISNRSPNSLVIADTTIDEGGWPENEVIDVVPLDQGPSMVNVWQPEGWDRYYVYATCYNADRLYVIDPIL